MRFILTFIVCCSSFFIQETRGEDSASYFRLLNFENNMKYVAINMVKIPYEGARLAAAKDLRDSLREILYMEASYEYAFDSLKSIKIIKSEDGKVRLYTFTVILNNQNHYNYGFIQYKTKKGIGWVELEDPR